MSDAPATFDARAALAELATLLDFPGPPEQLPGYVLELVQGLRRESEASAAALRASEAERAPILKAIEATNARNAALEAGDAAKQSEIESLQRQLNAALVKLSKLEGPMP